MKTIDKNKSVSDTRNANRNPAYNKNTDKNHDPDSRTFNEDEQSWKNRQGAKQATSSTDYRYDDEQRDASDYISCDRNSYNLEDARFGCFEPEEW